MDMTNNKAVSVKYALTVTLSKLMYRLEPLDQFIQSKQELHRLFKHIEKQIKKIHGIAELTLAGNVHWHFTIQFYITEKLKYNTMIKNLFRNEKCIGYTCLKQLDDEPGWEVYKNKCIYETYEELDAPPFYDNNDDDPLNLNFFKDYEIWKELQEELDDQAAE